MSRIQWSMDVDPKWVHTYRQNHKHVIDQNVYEVSCKRISTSIIFDREYIQWSHQNSQAIIYIYIYKYWYALDLWKLREKIHINPYKWVPVYQLCLVYAFSHSENSEIPEFVTTSFWNKYYVTAPLIDNQWFTITFYLHEVALFFHDS